MRRSPPTTKPKVKSHLATPPASQSCPLEAATMDLDSDLLNFDGFFAPNNDDEVADLWDLTTSGHDQDLLDIAELEPLSPLKEEPPELEKVNVKQGFANKHGLKLDTKLINSTKDDSSTNSNGTPTATLPARFALLSTTCVYEPGFTTSPRGKRRISQTRAPVPAFEIPVGGDEEEDEAEDEVEGGDDEPFMLQHADDFYMPDFTAAELAAMVDSPSKVSTTSTNSPTVSPSRGLNDAMPHSNPFYPESLLADPVARSIEQEIPDVINLFNSFYDSSQSFLATQQQPFDLTGSIGMNGLPAASQAMFPATFNMQTAPPAVPFDYFSPSGYAAAANQFLDSYGQQVQPFFINPSQFAQQVQAQTTNVQLAAVMAMANSAAAMNSMRKMNGSYGVPIAPMQRPSLPNTQVKAAAPIKPRLPVQRAVSATSSVGGSAANGKGNRVAITPDIADFKLVQIFHQFCDPTTKMLTLPRFHQLVLHHQVKDESSDSKQSDGSCCSSSPSANGVVTPDAQALFEALDINGAGALDLERFMHSFQICNRCTEAKRRAHQALCASQGQTFTPTPLERQLMEDVSPVVVRVVPTRFEGHKVKSCEHYQWTWCEGYEKSGNEKCLGTNRHDKCPKYLANCTLWKHKLPPKSRKPKLVHENVDSPTKKLKHFS